jgi:uracil-DNA glycosylase
MNAALRKQYLDAMGITPWALRAPPQLAAPIGPEAAPATVTASATVTAPARVTAPAAVAAPAWGAAPEAGEETLGWLELRDRVAACTRCALSKTRTQTVFGVGDQHADWLIVGEAPGAEEDRRGEPFVGRAGQLLNSMLRAIGLEREQVYIANVLKCRPPGNRNPEPEEVARCEPYLKRQVALVRPKLIVAMGRFAVQSLLKTTASIASLRGRVHEYEGVPVVVTYHPAYLLRSLPDKAKAWTDLCLAQATYERLQG